VGLLVCVTGLGTVILLSRNLLNIEGETTVKSNLCGVKELQVCEKNDESNERRGRGHPETFFFFFFTTIRSNRFFPAAT
jgi:hypothetical protein